MADALLFPGDLVSVPCAILGNHFGVYIAPGVVMHLMGDGDPVSRTSLNDFKGDSTTFVIESCPSNIDRNDVIERALVYEYKQFRDQDYNVKSNNCEHFARWCLTGVARSLQVEGIYKWCCLTISGFIFGTKNLGSGSSSCKSFGSSSNSYKSFGSSSNSCKSFGSSSNSCKSLGSSSNSCKSLGSSSNSCKSLGSSSNSCKSLGSSSNSCKSLGSSSKSCKSLGSSSKSC
ncbi:keratin-associated protein 13-2-like [Anneissia japonica]|uniref:keratin-associated protein 13-2-like n=1 Tax=Anneissia japonica TaxID=1529436 RepID=UPI0014255BE7|nr:keratin-associated protein 13-2-like [Anneissia japonica]